MVENYTKDIKERDMEIGILGQTRPLLNHR